MSLKYVVIGAVAIQMGLYSAAQAGTVSYWPMDGTGVAAEGATVADVVGSNNGVVVDGDLDYVAGPPASPSALLFERDDPDSHDKIDVPDSPSLHFNLDEDDFTMEMIFRVTDGSINNQGLFAKNGTSGGDSQYWARYRSSGGVQFLLRGDAAGAPENGGTTPAGSVTEGRWTHFAATYEAGSDEIKLWVNAEPGDTVPDTTIAVSATSGVIGVNPEGLIIGGFTTNSREFGGEIAAVRFSNMALAPADFLPVVPEPTSLALALIALAGLSNSAVRNRRK